MSRHSGAFAAVNGLLDEYERLVGKLTLRQLSEKDRLHSLALAIVRVLSDGDARPSPAPAGGAAAGGDDVRQLALQLVEALRQEGTREPPTHSSAGP